MAILNDNITDKLKYLLCVQDITKLQIWGVGDLGFKKITLFNAFL